MLGALTALTLSGCELLSPEEPIDEPDTGTADAGGGEDAGGDDAGGDDAGADTDTGGTDGLATCRSVSTSPNALTIGDEPTTVTWSLTCDAELTADALGERATLTPATGSPLEFAVESVSCEPAEGGHTCELTLAGVALPEDAPPGPTRYAAGDGEAADLDLDLRARLGNQAISGLQIPRDLVPLPAGFADRGEDLRVAQTEAGRVVAGTVRSESGDRLDLFTVAPDGVVTVHETLEAPDGLFQTTGFASRGLGDGVEAIWWGFDASQGVFSGTSVRVGPDGGAPSIEAIDLGAYTGPTLAKVVDAHVEEVQGRLSVVALARTDADGVVLVRVFGGPNPSEVSVVRQPERVADLDPATLDTGRYGVVEGATGGARLWGVDASGKLSIESADDPNTSSQATLPETTSSDRFSLTELEGYTVVRMESGGEGGDVRILALPTDDKGALTGTVFALRLPENCRPDRRLVFKATATSLAAFGRWPWNWRDKLKSSAAPPMMVLQWDLDGASPLKAIEPTSVRPAVAEDPSAATGAGSGDRVLATVTGDGALELLEVDALTAPCADPKACAAPYGGTTDDGLRGNLLPGVTGPTWAVDKYGDILIDGVPLEFDVIGGPPIFMRGSGGSTLMVAGVAHDAATHAIWRVAEGGSLSEPGLLTLDTGEGGPELVLKSAEEGEAPGGGGDTGGLTLTIATTMIDFTRDSDGSGDEDSERPEATFTTTTGALEAAIGAAEPVTIDLAGQLPALADAPLEVALLPIVPHDRATHTYTSREVLGAAEFTLDDIDVDFVVSRERDGTARISAVGSSGAVADYALDGGWDDDVLLFKQAGAGDAVYISGCGASVTRLSVIAGPDGIQAVADTITTDGATGPIVSVEDYDGDGLDDVFRRDSCGEDGASAGGTIYFGADAAAPLPLVGGPSITFPPNAEATTGNGKGTKKATAYSYMFWL
jgi:hypothetical protein